MGDAVIFVGLHFGAIELPALYLAERVGGAVAPMETIDDAGLQDWFVRTRGAVGVRIVGLREARRALLEALREGTSVGLVGDRDLTGGGTLTTFFGAPARLPLGPAMLGVESGARLYVVGVRRGASGQYGGRLEPVAVPAEGTRRERVTATTAGLARAFERLIQDAPEQWWAVFFPIWPDLEAGPRSARRRRRDDATPSDRGRRADLHVHTVASDGTADVVAILDHVGRLGDLDVVAITDHERIDAAQAARAMAIDQGRPFEVVVGEEVTTLGGHLLALYLERPVRPYRSLRTTILDIHDAGGLAIPAHPLVPYPLCAQGWVLRRLLDDPEAARPPGRPRDVQPHRPRPTVARSGRALRRSITDCPRWATATPMPWPPSARGWTAFEGRTAADLRRAIETGATTAGGAFHGTTGQLGVFGQQLRKRAVDARDEVRGRVRRDGTGRDHGYPGGRARPPRYDPGPR